jgi:hypothetical protein
MNELLAPVGKIVVSIRGSVLLTTRWKLSIVISSANASDLLNVLNSEISLPPQ